MNVITSIPRAVELTGAMFFPSGDMNGIYTRFGKDSLFYRKSVSSSESWILGHLTYHEDWLLASYRNREGRLDVYDAHRIFTYGLVCNTRPDCPGRWKKNWGCPGWKDDFNSFCDAHEVAWREVQCSQVCGVHGTVVANAITCECSCRHGFSGARCDIYLGWLADLFSPRGLSAGTTNPRPESETAAEPELGNLPELLAAMAGSGGTGAEPNKLPVKTTLADTALGLHVDTSSESAPELLVGAEPEPKKLPQ